MQKRNIIISSSIVYLYIRRLSSADIYFIVICSPNCTGLIFYLVTVGPVRTVSSYRAHISHEDRPRFIVTKICRVHTVNNMYKDSTTSRHAGALDIALQQFGYVTSLPKVCSTEQFAGY